jgi:hypothetical protein
LSSQTTDTPGTTQTKNVQDRSGATFQTYPTAEYFANPLFSSCSNRDQSPPGKGALASGPFFQAVQRGFGRYFSASAAATQKTIHANKAHRKSPLPRQP